MKLHRCACSQGNISYEDAREAAIKSHTDEIHRFEFIL